MPSFLSDHVQFRFASLAELMHEVKLSEALSRYDALGGDALLKDFDYDILPEGIYNRLQVAEQLTKEIMCQEQWMRIGKQPLADGGAQLFCMFEGMFRQMKREFVDKVCTMLRVNGAVLDNAVAKIDFIEGVDESLRQMAEGILQQTDDHEYIGEFIDRLFAKTEFVKMLFEQRPTQLELMKKVVPLQNPDKTIDVFAYAFRLCCEAVVVLPEQRGNRIERLCKLGNPKHLYPRSSSHITHL